MNIPREYSDAAEKHRQAYEGSVDMLKGLLAGPEYGSIGFFASSVDRENYKRLFARDAFWIGMAALVSGEETLIKGCKASLDTLARYQREDGAIPSNVSPDGKVSYGIINPRVDPTTLFILGCVQYCRMTGDTAFLASCLDPVKRAMDYLENVWENNRLELIYTPRAGNWADEYLQQGYVLYDEVLWHLAIREYAGVLRSDGDVRAGYYEDKAERVKKTIREKFWVKSLEGKEVDHFPDIRRKFDLEQAGYFLHFYFAVNKTERELEKAHGIFDAFGNILALLAGVAAPGQVPEVIRFIDEVSVNKYPLVPAHYPFFPEDIFKSARLHQYRFKEYVGHYHNGGLWCWYTGLYVAFLVKAGETAKALKFLDGIMEANSQKKNGMNYYEYHTGKMAGIDLKIRRTQGVDLYLSIKIKEALEKRKSTVQVLWRKGKIDARDDIAVRSIGVKAGENLKLDGVGPDVEQALDGIALIEDDNGRCFEYAPVIVRGSSSGGAPCLGVSAAAYIIGYKAFYEGKIVFG